MLKAIKKKSVKVLIGKKIYMFSDIFCLKYNVFMCDLLTVGLNDSWVGWSYL